MQQTEHRCVGDKDVGRHTAHQEVGACVETYGGTGRELTVKGSSENETVRVVGP